MPAYITACLCWGLLSRLLIATGAIECTENEAPEIKPKPNTMKLPTECLIECSSMTYINKLQLQDDHNIRITDSTEGELGEYCWSSKLKCTIGESFVSAYVVVPVDVSMTEHEQLQVRTSAPRRDALHIHSSPTTIADSCGFRYEVTTHFSTPDTDTSFCVQIVTQEDDLGDRLLRCPPYLVTFWQRNPNQSNKQGAG
ncbi:uncharacterized protein LOC105355224 [Oryzias latipes]|uniref:uncharacterized protein LOC105355224 n=1 Tax=Oryzias latipes TaxID=8090 RepID=UPI0005CC70FE|nr:uncharacterized protein LOC105355224 [Oryzias latipes]